MGVEGEVEGVLAVVVGVWLEGTDVFGLDCFFGWFLVIAGG